MNSIEVGSFSDRTDALNAVKRYPGSLRYLCDQFRGDPDLSMEAVQRSGEAIRWASETLRGDPEIAFIALTTSPNAIAFISDELRSNASFMESVRYARREKKRAHEGRFFPRQSRPNTDYATLALVTPMKRTYEKGARITLETEHLPYRKRGENCFVMPCLHKEHWYFYPQPIILNCKLDSVIDFDFRGNRVNRVHMNATVISVITPQRLLKSDPFWYRDTGRIPNPPPVNPAIPPTPERRSRGYNYEIRDMGNGLKLAEESYYYNDYGWGHWSIYSQDEQDVHLFMQYSEYKMENERDCYFGHKIFRMDEKDE